MKRSTLEIVGILNNLVPFSEDDLENDNVDFLYELTDELLINSDASEAIKSLFLFLEKYPRVDFGSPGPIVHTLEKFRDQYEPELFESLKRKPTLLTIWMLNRIINGTNNERTRDILIAKMREILDHESVSEIEKAEVNNFMNHQLKK
ncbi:MAG: hypothetical protein IPL46_13965 [Saprospiraceae bacterium]|nr:hypothetical protein [Saprospiraceae bacterium]